jgi:hypothetical protein
MHTRFAPPTCAAIAGAAAIALLATRPALADEGPATEKLVVLDLDVPKGLEVRRAYFADTIREYVTKQAPQLFVMTRENMLQLLKAVGKKLEECQGECEVETGRNVQADYVVSGGFTLLPDGRLSLKLKLHETTGGRFLGSEDDIGRNEADVLEKLPRTVSALMTLIGGLFEVAPDAKDVTVSINSEPDDAGVTLDGRPFCPSTPCTKKLKEGRHALLVHKEGYEPAAKTIDASRETKFGVVLVRRVGDLTIASAPSGLSIVMDGKSVGRSPVTVRELASGPHEISVDDPCYQATRERIQVRSGEKKEYTLTTKPFTVDIIVAATDDSGAQVKGKVTADGKPIGETPGTLPVPMCATALRMQVDEAIAVRQLKMGEARPGMITLTLPVARCSRTKTLRKAAIWGTAGTAALGVVGMVGAWAMHSSAIDAPPGDSGTSGKVSMGKALNVVGLVGLAAAVAGGAALFLLPSDDVACGTAP